MTYFNDYLKELLACTKNPLGMWRREVAEDYWELYTWRDMLGRLKKYRYLAA